MVPSPSVTDVPDVIDRLRKAIGDRYAIQEELGSGGMASVYLAEDRKHHRQVAIKVLKPELAQAIGGDRFLREIEIAAQLQHPHVLPLYDSGEAGGLLYYVMPYVKGDSLRDRLAREGELPVADAVRILRDVADALAHAHEQGVVHRDVKPDNVMLSGHHAVVTDFGVAKAVSEAAGTAQLTTAGMALGTPSYMAPEQATADPNTDHRADIYALGVLGYEMLAGELPFTGSTAQAVLSAQVTESPRPVDARRPAVPNDLAALVMKCLEKKPADRWQDAAEIRRLLDGMSTPSAGTLPVPAVAPAGRRTATLIGVGVVGAIAIGVGIFTTRDAGPVPVAAANTMVAPFVPTVPDSALAVLGRNLAVTLSTNLDGVGDIAVVDPLTVLAGFGEGETPTLERATALAQRLGATSVIHGTSIASGTDVRLDAGMYDVSGREPLARVSVTGPMDNLGALTDSLTWALLRQLWRGAEAPPTPSLEAVTTGSVDALKAFLEGEELALANRWFDASDAYARAIAADSSFWLAYWRYAYAMEWFGRPVDSVVTATYQQQRFRLPDRERLLIEARMAAGSVSVRLDVLERVVRRFPGFWPGWMAYADHLTHHGGLVGRAPDEAIAALRRVLELNPRFTPGWNHLATSTLDRYPWLSDSAWREIPEHGGRALPQAAHLAQWIQETATLGAPSDSLLDAIREDQGAGGFSTAWGVAHWVATFGLDPVQGAARLAERFPHDPTHLGVTTMLWAQRGAWDTVTVLLGRLAEMGPGPASGDPVYVYAQAATLAWLGAIESDVARSFRTRAESATRTAQDSVRLRWADGIVAVAHNDPVALSEALESLQGVQHATTSDARRSLAAFAARLAGNHQAATDSLVALEWERPAAARTWRHSFPALTVVNRMAASRWLMERGDAGEALRLSHWFDSWPVSNIQFSKAFVRPLVRLEQGRMAEQLGRTDLARFYYQSFLERYDLPLPRHQHLVDEAEAALARLAGVGPER